MHVVSGGNIQLMDQSIPRVNIPPATPGVLHLLSARVPGFVPSELCGRCLGVIRGSGLLSIIISTKLSVDAA